MSDQKSNFLVWIVVVPLVGAMVLCGGCMTVFRSLARQNEKRLAAMTPEQRSAEESRKAETLATMDAEIATKRVIKTALKAPDTAKFSELKVSRFSAHTWVVVGDVTSVNTFNAPVRNEFMVTLYRPDDAKGARDFRIGSVHVGKEKIFDNPEVNALINADEKKR